MVNAEVLGMALLTTCWCLAAFSDLRNMTIPNVISLAMIIGFLALFPFSSLSLSALLFCLAAAAITFIICFVLFAANVMGGGDAKLLTASALWFGLSQPLLQFVVYTALFGGILTIAILILRTNGPVVVRLASVLPHSLTNGKKVPYGLAIALSGLMNLNSMILIQPSI